MIFLVPTEYVKKVCSVCKGTQTLRSFDRRGNLLRRRWLKDKCARCYDRIRHTGKYNWKKKRNRVIDIVGKGLIRCRGCGCDMRELLEINHINGGGTQENNNVGKFICDILAGRRKTDDLDLRCKVCNALHYLELKYGTLPFEIKWLTPRLPSTVSS